MKKHPTSRELEQLLGACEELKSIIKYMAENETEKEAWRGARREARRWLKEIQEQLRFKD